VSERWRVARLEELRSGEVMAVECGEREIALYRVGDAVYATDNFCSHGAARLCEGFLDGHTIECPLHQGAFDIRTGAATREPADEPIETFRVEIEDGAVYVVAVSTTS
jgi:naphthalene 1,2-dioxygenase system ferredoxin subunit